MKYAMGHGIFITGTDTGIGKTYVARLLLEEFMYSRTATYMKPVQTGCLRDARGNLAAPDFNYVMEKGAPMSAELDDHVPYRFEPACSPHLAASLAGVTISLELIREKFSRVSDKKTITVVEGAGGVMTPLSETATMIDLMLHLKLPVVVVTTPRVGTLNHTLLSLHALAEKGIDAAGLVVNNVHEVPEDFIYHDTVLFLKRHVPEAAFLQVGHAAECDSDIRDFCKALFEHL
jgi:dethiobiotin synthase